MDDDESTTVVTVTVPSLTITVTATSVRPSTSRSVLGPLTTIFTPLANCASCYASLGDPLCTAFFSNCRSQQGCLPSIGSATSVGYGFYSPGLYCPHEWTVALYYDQVPEPPAPKLSSLMQTLLPGENGALCCPEGYSLRLFEDIWGPKSIGPAMCVVEEVNPNGFTYFACSDGRAQNLFRGSGFFTTIAPAVQINWQSSDVLPFITGTNTAVVPLATISRTRPTEEPFRTSSESPSRTSAALTSTTTSTAGPGPPTGSANNPNISRAALAGVVVGSIFGFLICAVGIWLLVKAARRRRRKVDVDEYQETSEETKSTQDGITTKRGHISELSGEGRYELPVPAHVPELEGLTPLELDGTAKQT
ncbi:hypothetical protein GE09DRAFT_362534 [Coniochaeta sp. 2T2.1]|nr:hypothetical protein GE09DRAFT_362534 [Coniochaeta sp. 2T2.1]